MLLNPSMVSIGDFSIITKSPKIFIDDYAHHPNEIESIVSSVKNVPTKI